MPISYLLTPTVSVSRASVGTRRTRPGIVEIAANLPRYEKVAACGAVTLTDRGAYMPLAVDTVRDWLLCDSTADTKKLYALKTAGGTPELVKDMSTLDGHVEGHYIKAAGCNQGNWFVWMGDFTDQDGVTLKCRLLKSSDEGATWTAVKTTTYGPCSGSHMTAFLGDMMAWGTYSTVTVGGHAVFLSRDKGETWETVMELANSVVGRHCHGVFFDGPDSLYVIWGDGVTSRLEKYAYADVAWTKTVIRDDLTTLAGGNEGAALIGGKVIVNGRWSSIYDPATGTFRRFGPRIPVPIEAGQTPYGYVYGGGTHRHKYVEHAGVLYAPGYTYSAPFAGGSDVGLYVSPDGGLHWTSVFLLPTERGVRDLVGPWKGLFWATRISGDGVNSMCSFPPVSAALVNALRLEAGSTNLLHEAGSTFSIGAAKATRVQCGWARGASYDGGTNLSDASIVGADTDVAGIHGPHCLRMVGAAGSMSRARYNSPTVAMTNGDKITAVVWARAKAPWPEGYTVSLGIEAATGSVAASTYLGSSKASEDEWLPLVAELTCTGTGTFRIYVQIGTQEPSCTFAADDYVTPAANAYASKTQSLEIQNGSPVRFGGGTLPVGIAASTTYYVRDWDGTKFKVAATPGGDPIDIPDNGSGTHYCWVLADWTLYLDAACVRVNASRWDVSSFQIGGTARADESATISLAGYTEPWSLVFAWRPESGWAEHSADFPLLTIHGADGTSMCISWYAAEKCFQFTPTEGGAVLSPIISWRHFDTIWFAVSRTEDGFTFRVWDPVTGVQVVDGTGLAFGAPIDAHFGIDATGTVFGTGLFHSYALRRSVISAPDFAVITGEPGWNFRLAPHWILGMR